MRYDVSGIGGSLLQHQLFAIGTKVALPLPGTVRILSQPRVIRRLDPVQQIRYASVGHGFVEHLSLHVLFKFSQSLNISLESGVQIVRLEVVLDCPQVSVQQNALNYDLCKLIVYFAIYNIIMKVTNFVESFGV